MHIELTPEFSTKVFQKVGALSKTDFDLSTERQQMDYCAGFIDYLEKEASLSPEMAVGFIKYLAEQGNEWMEKEGMVKSASEENDKVADWYNDAMGGIGKGMGWLASKGPQSMQQGAAQGYLGGQGDNFMKNTGVGKWLQSSGVANQAGKAWDWIKKPEHYKPIAGALAGAVGGGLISKLFGGGNTATALGAGAGGLLGYYTMNNGKDLGNAWQAVQEKLRGQNSKAIATAQ